MADPSVMQTTRLFASRGLLWPAIVIVAAIAAYAPTIRQLIDGPWRTEQEGHGPLIIVAAIWLVWQARAELKAATISPAPIIGWIILIGGLLLMFLARTQGVLTVEVLSEFPVIIGSVLILAGWRVLRILAFPIAFLVFSVPVPDWMIDAVTVPLKVIISDLVTQVLYSAGYPVAQNGVMIMIGSYQLLVKDACSGMNSIFALSAIAVFYVYTFHSDSKIRSALLLLSIVPITFVANFIRVISLVLIAYYGGADQLEGVLHDFTGIGLFIVALSLMFFVDAILSLIGMIFRRSRLSARFPPAAGSSDM